MTKPAWYIPYTDRHRVSPDEAADSDRYDDETGETDRRIRAADKASRDWQAAHPKTKR